MVWVSLCCLGVFLSVATCVVLLSLGILSLPHLIPHNNPAVPSACSFQTRAALVMAVVCFRALLVFVLIVLMFVLFGAVVRCR